MFFYLVILISSLFNQDKINHIKTQLKNNTLKLDSISIVIDEIDSSITNIENMLKDSK